MSEMPTLGHAPRQSPIIPVAVTAIIVGLLTGGIFWLKNRPPESAPAIVTPQLAVGLEPQVPVAAAPTAAVPSAPAAPAATPDKSGLHAFQVKINGPLESAIVGSEGKAVGAPLTQVVNRSLVWWVRVPQDLVKGDTLAVVYEPRDGQEPLVHAVRFESRKQGKVFETYRFKPTGDGFARSYQADGSELEERLVDSPLDTYEQVTSDRKSVV